MTRGKWSHLYLRGKHLAVIRMGDAKVRHGRGADVLLQECPVGMIFAAVLIGAIMIVHRHVVMAAGHLIHCLRRGKGLSHRQAMGLFGKGQQPGEHEAKRQSLSQI